MMKQCFVEIISFILVSVFILSCPIRDSIEHWRWLNETKS